MSREGTESSSDLEEKAHPGHHSLCAVVPSSTEYSDGADSHTTWHANRLLGAYPIPSANLAGSSSPAPSSSLTGSRTHRNALDAGGIDGPASGGTSILTAAATMGNTIISSLLCGSMPSADDSRGEDCERFLGVRVDSTASPNQSSLVSWNRDDAGA